MGSLKSSKETRPTCILLLFLMAVSITLPLRKSEASRPGSSPSGPHVAQKGAFDWGFTLRADRSFNAYNCTVRWFKPVIGRTVSLTRTVSIFDVVRIGGQSYFSTDPFLLLPVGVAASASQDLGVFDKVYPPTFVEINLDFRHAYRLFLGIDYDFMFFNVGRKPGFQRGIILSPQFGGQVQVGPIDVRLFACHDNYIMFNTSDRSFGWRAGMGLLSGFAY